MTRAKLGPGWSYSKWTGVYTFNGEHGTASVYKSRCTSGTATRWKISCYNSTTSCWLIENGLLTLQQAAQIVENVVGKGC